MRIMTDCRVWCFQTAKLAGAGLGKGDHPILRYLGLELLICRASGRQAES